MANIPLKHFLIARLYTRFVAVSKLVCLLVALVLISVLIILPLVHPVEKRFKLKSVPEEQKDQSITHSPRMSRPHFQGIDGKGQPYNILADQAIQQDKSTLRLESINADITLKGGSWLAMVAQHGTMNLPKKNLSLQGKVSFFVDNGYEFRTERMDMNFAQGTAISLQPIELQGPTLVLRAKTFEAKNSGDLLLFKGEVHVVLYPSQRVIRQNNSKEKP